MKKAGLGNPRALFQRLRGYLRPQGSLKAVLPILVILLIAAAFRIPFLGVNPNGLYCDEASMGYDAYSILKTGRDRFGTLLPLFARSFGDFREAIYVYAIVPCAALFGLNEFATRLPAALMGLATVYVLYLLVRECVDKKTALASALFLAISPWHVQFSRMAFRAISWPLLFCLGLYWFFRAIKRDPRKLFVSAVFFALSLWTYFSGRVFLPLFLAGLAAVYARDLWKIKKEAGIAAGIFMAVIILLAFQWFSPQGMARANQVTAFAWKQNIRFYFSYFDPAFLFLRGDGNLRHSIMNTGELHLFEIVTVLAGIIAALIRFRRPEQKVFLLWLVFYPFPAMFTYGPHAMRAIIGAPIFAILSGSGLIGLASLFRAPWPRRVFTAVAFLIIAASTVIFAQRYFRAYPRYASVYWQYGMRDAVTFAKKSAYDPVIFSMNWGENPLHQANVFVLFYTKYPPALCQREIGTLDAWGRATFGRYHIRSIPDQLNVRNKALLVMLPDETPKIPPDLYSWKVVDSVRDPHGREVLKLLEIRRK